MRVETAQSKAEWNTFVERNNGPVYNCYEWGELCEIYGHNTDLLFVREDDEVVAGLPLIHMKSQLFGNKVVSMPFSEYGSVVYSEDASDSAVQRLLDETKRYANEVGADFVSLRGRDIGDRDEFTREKRYLSFQLSLEGSEDDLWMRLKSGRRRHIRRAWDNDIQVKQVESIAGLKRYYQLYLKDMRRHGSPPHSFACFSHLWNTLGKRGHMKVYLATMDNQPVNGCIGFRFGENVYAWDSVTDYAYRDLDGGSLVAWETIRRACEHGYSTLHFGRTRQDSGVCRFKKTFGGTLVWLDDYHYFPDGTVDLSDVADSKYDVIKRAWRRLPLPVTRTIGPHIRGDISL